jgi:hypothetical protein
MGKQGIVLTLAVLLFGSLACDSIPFLTFPLMYTATATSTITPTSTVTLTPTLSPYPTRTSSPTLIPGIEETVNVGDAELLITKVLRRSSFRCGDHDGPVENPKQEEFLLVLFKIVKGPALLPKNIKTWIHENEIDSIEIDSSTQDSIPYESICYSQNKDTQVLTELDLAFLIGLEAEGFILVLPDGTEIPLDSFFP